MFVRGVVDSYHVPIFEIHRCAILKFKIRVLQDRFPVSDAMLS